ncbi:MAG: hypothetical protein KAH24_01395 [Holophagae bacterium]|nr:hypothetical protein [Holophagae bacterium]
MKSNRAKTARHPINNNISLCRLIATLFLLLIFGTAPLPSLAQSPQSIKNLDIHGAVIIDFFQNHNGDGNFTHYATDSGSDFTSTVKESWFSLSGSLGQVNGMETTFEASFDFMGENDFEIVTAWIRIEKQNWYFLAGKAESLVATGETTLNYDGFYSSGGIQTGAKANQNQIQIGYKIKNHFTLAVSITDEPAQNGSMDGQHFSSERPAVESALFFDFTWGSGKIAGHTGNMKLDSHEHFHPATIMAELTIPITESISWLISGFRAKAGSQFFTTDILFDCIPLPDGHSHECSAKGGLTELLFQAEKTQAWIGFGTFSLTDASKTHYRLHHPEDILTDNHRLSIGSRYDFSDHLHAGLEITRYRTRHLKDTEISTIKATSIQLQFSITF